MVTFSGQLVFVGAIALAWTGAAVAETQLRSGKFSMTGDEAKKESLVYVVECEQRQPCVARLSDGPDNRATLFPIVRNETLRKRIRTELANIKAANYPASHDNEYVQFDGQRVTDCWTATDDPGGAGGLCRFEAQGGAETWIVVWGDMCSGQCYSGFVPIIMQPAWK